jgi:hypothetical protein
MMSHTLNEPRMDRRRHARDPVTRPCKVLHAAAARYIAGETRDVSPEGVFITVESPREIAVGDRVEILIAWNDRGLLQERDARQGRVVRVMQGPGQRQYLGVQLAHAVTTSIAA